MRTVFLLLILGVYGVLSAKVVDLNSIDTNKKVIQLAVFKNYEPALRLASKYDKYDVFIEKVENYTVYLVNQEQNNVNITLKEIKKDFKDVFVIKKSVFFMDKNINNTISEEEIKTSNFKPRN